MSAITNRRRSFKLNGLKQEHLVIQKLLQDRKLKKKLLELQCKRYRVHLPSLNYAQMSADQIIQTVRAQWRKQLAAKAARTVVVAFQVRRLHRLKKLAAERQQMAACKIQLAWKGFKASCLDPRRRLVLENEAAITIQRVYRGYRTRNSREVFKLVRLNKIELMYRAFMQVKQGLLAKCAVVISKYWRMFRAISETKLLKIRRDRKEVLLRSVFRLKTTASSVTQYTVPTTPIHTCCIVSPTRRRLPQRNPRRRVFLELN
jgi:hypothetical protein